MLSEYLSAKLAGIVTASVIGVTGAAAGAGALPAPAQRIISQTASEVGVHLPEPPRADPPPPPAIAPPTTPPAPTPPPTTAAHEPERHEPLAPVTPSTEAPAPPSTEAPHEATTTPPRHEPEHPAVPALPAPPAPPPSEPAPPTTRVENHAPENITLSCARDGAAVRCEWSRPDVDFTRYALLRTTPGAQGRVVYTSEDKDVRTFTDATVEAGHTYTYMVVVIRTAGTTEGHSNRVAVPV